MDELWIPIVFFIAVFASVWVVMYYRHLNHLKRMETLAKLAETGGEVKPEMLAMMMTKQVNGPLRDLRTGLIWIAIGVPITLAFLVEQEWVGASFGLAPVLIGIAYLVVMKLGYKEDGQQSSPTSL